MNVVKKIKGVILRNSWMPPEQNRISLYTFVDQKEFLIGQTATEKQLRNLVSRCIIVDGRIQEIEEVFDEYKREEITIFKFTQVFAKEEK